MTVEELRNRLDEYGDHVEVKVAAYENETDPKHTIVEVDDDIASKDTCVTILYS